MKAEGLEFPDAVRFGRPRGHAGTRSRGEAERKAAAPPRERLYALCKDAARFYYRRYGSRSIGRRSSISLAAACRRVMNQFGLGYAPDSFHALIDAMTAKGYAGRTDGCRTGQSAVAKRGGFTTASGTASCSRSLMCAAM